MQKSCKDDTVTQEVQHMHLTSFRREFLLTVMTICQKYLCSVSKVLQIDETDA